VTATATTALILIVPAMVILAIAVDVGAVITWAITRKKVR
jgi:hypothetical protein